jgi:hypothetical protein
MLKGDGLTRTLEFSFLSLWKVRGAANPRKIRARETKRVNLMFR